MTVFFLEGGRPTFGPRAAELTGEFYKNLWDHDYFAVKNQDAQNAPAPAERSRAGLSGSGRALTRRAVAAKCI